jgi:hypothetical protein
LHCLPPHLVDAIIASGAENIVFFWRFNHTNLTDLVDEEATNMDISGQPCSTEILFLPKLLEVSFVKVIGRHGGFLSAEHDVDLQKILLVNRPTAAVVLVGRVVEGLWWK